MDFSHKQKKKAAKKRSTKDKKQTKEGTIRDIYK